MKQQQDLLNSFETIADEQWHAAIERFLKGKSLDQLHWEVEEGVVISPLQRRSTTSPVAIPWNSTQGGNQWRLTDAVIINSKDAIEVANRLLLDALHAGADALVVQWHYVPNTQELECLTAGILLDLVTLHFEATAVDAAAMIAAIHQWPAALSVTGSCAFAPTSPAVLWPILAPVAEQLSWRWLQFNMEDNGESLAQALYQASLWMDFLLEKGYSTTQIVAWMRFDCALETRYLVTLARIRAFKRCWLALLEAYKSPTVWPWLHARTVNVVEADPYRNMLVGTTQAMAAVVAGVDSLWVCPSDGLETATTFTRRIARNVQHLLQAESYLNRVVDPAAGAYYIEHLTNKLTEQAWQQFCTL